MNMDANETFDPSTDSLEAQAVALALIAAAIPSASDVTEIKAAVGDPSGDTLTSLTAKFGDLPATLTAILGNPTGDTLATLTAKWGDLARNLATLLGTRWDASGDLGTDIASIVEDAYEAAHHVHNREHWFGKSADQSGDDWALLEGLTTFQAISGNGDFGSDANDEAKVLGVDDTPIIAGQTKFDIHKILVQALSTDTPWIIRVVYGSGTMAAAISAGQYSEIMVQNIVTGSKAGGVPIQIMMPQCVAGTDQIWIQAKNATDNATCDFFVGVHGYAS